LKGIVVGEVVEKTKHPDADKLSITKVNVGGTELLNIVCGDRMLLPAKSFGCACRLQIISDNRGTFRNKKNQRYACSFRRNICAEDEIGLGTDHDGIISWTKKQLWELPLPNIF